MPLERSTSGLATTNSHAARSSWLGAFSGGPSVTTQNFDSGFTDGSIDSGPPRRNRSWASSIPSTASQATRWESSEPPGGMSIPRGGAHSTRGFNVENGLISWFQKVNGALHVSIKAEDVKGIIVGEENGSDFVPRRSPWRICLPRRWGSAFGSGDGMARRLGTGRGRRCPSRNQPG